MCSLVEAQGVQRNVPNWLQVESLLQMKQFQKACSYSRVKFVLFVVLMFVIVTRMYIGNKERRKRIPGPRVSMLARHAECTVSIWLVGWFVESNVPKRLSLWETPQCSALYNFDQLRIFNMHWNRTVRWPLSFRLHRISTAATRVRFALWPTVVFPVFLMLRTFTVSWSWLVP